MANYEKREVFPLESFAIHGTFHVQHKVHVYRVYTIILGLQFLHTPRCM